MREGKQAEEMDGMMREGEGEEWFCEIPPPFFLRTY